MPFWKRKRLDEMTRDEWEAAASRFGTHSDNVLPYNYWETVDSTMGIGVDYDDGVWLCAICGVVGTMGSPVRCDPLKHNTYYNTFQIGSELR